MRFPEFTEPWDRNKLSCFLYENKERNKADFFSKEDVLSVSGELGIVNQIELLGRSFAGKSVKDYHIVRKGNIVYTKSPLKEFPYGIIKYNRGVDGIVSTLYAVYHVLDNADGRFIEFYFTDKGRINRYLKPIVRIGAKHDMKIGNEEVLDNYVVMPTLVEQDKIATFIELLDKRIAMQSKLIEDLQQLKSAICKKLLSHSSWNEYIIDDICDSVSFKEYIAEVEENGSFPIIQQGETPILGYGNKKPYYNYNSVIIFGDHTLSLYKPQVPFLVATDGVKMLSPKPFVTRDFLYYLIETFMPISQGYKRHFSILKEQIVRLPSLKEQTIIGKRLSLLDTKIRIEQQLYDCYISQKQYLLGQMFI